MRSKWILYPNAKKKLEESGILRRIEQISGNAFISGAVYEDDIIYYAKEIQKSGALDKIPKLEADKFKSSLNNAFKAFFDGEVPKWLIRRNNIFEETRMEIEDFLLLSGGIAFTHKLLSDDELFDYKKFGFNNVFEFTGIVGSALMNTIREKTEIYIPGGLDWTTERSNCRTITSRIGGSMHYDLFISQVDITAYETKDPFGNSVSYRPDMYTDHMNLSTIHSTEPDFLVVILQYAEQMGIMQKIVESGAKEFIAFAKSLGQRGGATTEHLMGYIETPEYIFSKTLLIPIPKLENNKNYANIYSPYTFQSYGTADNAYYAAYIGTENELRIQLLPTSQRECISFIPDDIDKILKGLIYQCAMGIGRTSAKQIINMLKYRCSINYIKDKEKYSKLLLKK